MHVFDGFEEHDQRKWLPVLGASYMCAPPWLTQCTYLAQSTASPCLTSPALKGGGLPNLTSAALKPLSKLVH